MNDPEDDGMEQDPYQAPQVGPASGQEQYHGNHLGPGNLVRQLPVFGGLLIAQGALTILMGLFLVAMAMLPSLLEAVAAGANSSPHPVSPAYLMVVYGVLGALAITGGVVQIITGMKIIDFRGKTWGFVSIGVCIASVFTCYCGPTGIGLCIWGFILLLNPQVIEAIKQRESGRSKIDVLNMFY